MVDLPKSAEAKRRGVNPVASRAANSELMYIAPPNAEVDADRVCSILMAKSAAVREVS